LEKVKLPELLEMLKGEGITISKSTFQRYQRLGLIPPPIKAGKDDRGAPKYYYPQGIILVFEILNKVRAKVKPLEETIVFFEKRVIKKYKTILNKWGFSDYYLAEMRGIKPDEARKRDEEQTREWLEDWWQEKHGKPIEKDLLEVLTMHFSFYGKFQRKILKNLKWWLDDWCIELVVLKDINIGIKVHSKQLRSAISELSKEYEIVGQLNDRPGKAALDRMFERIKKELRQLIELSSKIQSRWKEIQAQYKDEAIDDLEIPFE